MLCNPIAIASNSLQFFQETEEGYLLPYENEEDLVNFINELNTTIDNLEEAIKEERQAHDNQIQIKNDKINNLEKQIESLKEIRDQLNNILENKNQIIKFQDEQIDMLNDIIRNFQEKGSINQSIINSYETQLSAKDNLLTIERKRRVEDIIRYSSYSLIAGVIIGIIIK